MKTLFRNFTIDEIMGIFRNWFPTMEKDQEILVRYHLNELNIIELDLLHRAMLQTEQERKKE